MLKLVCIPAYNEKSIQNVVKRCKKFADKVVVCDDGSTDNTSEQARIAGALVIKHEKNLGKGAALKTLFDYARSVKADLMVTIDGDLQFLPEEIPKLIKPIIEGDADMVIGYRFEDSDEMPTYRKVGNKILDKVTSIAADLPFKDTQSGFRSYSKKAIEKINFTSKGFAVDSEILVDAVQHELKISEAKVTVIYDTGSKTSKKDPVSHGTEVVSSLVEIIAVNNPLRYVGIPGIILIAIGILIGAYVLYTFNEIRYFSIPFTLVSVGTAGMGLILLLMSLVLYSIKYTTKK